MEFYDISPESIKESTATGNNWLIKPDDARPDNREPNAWRWTDVITIEKVRRDEVDWQDGVWERLSVQLRIGAKDENPNVNLNRVTFGDMKRHETEYLKPQAFGTKVDKNSTQWKKSNYANGMLIRFLSACDVDITDGISKEVLEECFGDESPLIGKQLWVEIKQKPAFIRNPENEEEWIEDPDGKKKDEITKYMRYE